MSLLYFWLIDGELCDWQWGCHNMITANVSAMWKRYEQQRIAKPIPHQDYNLIVECDGDSESTKVFVGMRQLDQQQEIVDLAMHLYQVLPPVTTGLRQHHLVGRFGIGVSKITGNQVAGRIMRVYEPHQQVRLATIRTSPSTIDCVWLGSVDFPTQCPECGSMFVMDDESLKQVGGYNDCKLNCLDCGHRWEIETL